jgi:hypothetical protein
MFVVLNIIVIAFAIFPFYASYAEKTPDLNYELIMKQQVPIKVLCRDVRTKTIYEMNNFYRSIAFLLCGLSIFNATFVIIGVIRMKKKSDQTVV